MLDFQPRDCFNKWETFEYWLDVNVDDVVFFFVIRISHNKITVRWKENHLASTKMPLHNFSENFK